MRQIVKLTLLGMVALMFIAAIPALAAADEAGTLVEIDDDVVVSKTEEDAPPPSSEKVYCTVWFLDNDDEVFYYEEVLVGRTLRAPEDVPQLADAYFMHWFDITSMDAAVFDFDIPIRGDVTLKPYFIQNIDFFDLPTDPTTEAWIAQDMPESPLYAADILAHGAPETPSFDQAAPGTMEEMEETPDGLSILALATEDTDETAESPDENSPAVDIGNRHVSIVVDAPNPVRYGDTVTLIGELAGFENDDISLQWQYNDGAGWADVAGQTEITYSYVVTPETANRTWQLNVTVNP